MSFSCVCRYFDLNSFEGDDIVIRFGWVGWGPSTSWMATATPVSALLRLLSGDPSHGFAYPQTLRPVEASACSREFLKTPIKLCAMSLFQLLLYLISFLIGTKRFFAEYLLLLFVSPFLESPTTFLAKFSSDSLSCPAHFLFPSAPWHWHGCL